jgi:hypothetical protein
MSYALVEDCLCVNAYDKEGEYFYFPLGEKKNIERALRVLIAYTNEKGIPFILMSLSEKMLDYLHEFDLTKHFTMEPRPEFFDYMYRREQLTGLRGKKLEGKRNHYNYFVKNYSYEFADLTESNAGACRDKLRDIIMSRSEDPEKELSATLTALEYRDSLNLVCKCLYADDNIAGIIMGENHHGTALIQIAKSDIVYRGASVALFKFFLENNLTECEHVNFMEDMGLPGLRKAKLSYNPDHFIEKSVLIMCNDLNI